MMKIERYTIKQIGMSGKQFAQEFVKAHDLKFLGDGACATVYKGKDCVYKIGAVEDNRAYLAYIQTIAESGIQNPFLPKVFGVRIVGKSMIVALEELSDNFYAGDMEKQIGISHYDLETLCKWIAYNHNNEHQAKIDEYSLNIKEGYRNELMAAAYIVAATTKSPNSKGCRFDMHSGNFMMRGNQIVITDPLCDNHI
jgi:hypothetical protein